MLGEGKLSAIISKAFNIATFFNPRRFGLGVVLGCGLCALCEVFSPALEQLALIDQKSLTLENLVMIALLMTHFRAIVRMALRRAEPDEQMEAAYDAFKLMQETGASDVHLKRAAADIYKTALDRINPGLQD